MVKSRLDDHVGEELESLGVWEPLDRDRARRVREGREEGGMGLGVGLLVLVFGPRRLVEHCDVWSVASF